MAVKSRQQMRDPETISAALARQRRTLGVHHKLDLSGPIQFEDRLGLSRLGRQKMLEELDLSGASLTSLHTLQAQPCLKVLRADKSKIEVLTGLERQTALSILSLIGTPVSENETFRISALIVSPKLSEINGEKVTHIERRQAQSYPPIAKALIGAGWVVQYPPPSEADFRFLVRTFDLNAEQKDFELPVTAPVFVSRSPPLTPEHVSSRPPNFGDRVSALLGELGFPIRTGERMEEDIIGAVDVLCRVVKKIEKMATEEPAD
jgi:hypothetical protein